RPEGLIPVNIARMVRRLVKTPGGVPVKDRPAERGALHRIAVTAARDMPAREHELELARARLAEQSDGRAAEPFLAAVMFDLLNHFSGVIGTVKADEDFANHRL